jgi:uncharacterized membrane protein YsdA (DUF1294 family)
MTKTRTTRIGPYHIAFGLVAVALTAVLVALMVERTDWNLYGVWIIALTVTTLALYIFDKLASQVRNAPRVPEVLLHVLSLLGGFMGGWIGVAVIGHKRNFSRHPAFVPILVVSTLLHASIAYMLFFGG